MRKLGDIAFQLLEKDPANWSARSLAILHHLESDRPGEAGALLLHAPEIPKDEDSLILVGRTLASFDPERALLFVDRALESNPENEEALVLRKSLRTSCLEREQTEPGTPEFPTQSVLEATAVKICSLVDPESLPRRPELEHDPPADPPLHFTPDEELAKTRHNVEIHVEEGPAVYDYADPPTSEVFAPAHGPDEILVAAPTLEERLDLHTPEELLAQRLEESRMQREETERKDRLRAVAITLAVHLALFVLLGLIIVAAPRTLPPEIVAWAGDDRTNTVAQKKVAQPDPEPPAASMAALPNLLHTSALAPVSMPEVDFDLPVDFGSGSTIGVGLGFGSGSGAGGAVSFFGARSSGRRILFILDQSASMKPHQMELRNKELERSLMRLPSGISYQVLLFAGGAYYADKGWNVKGGKMDTQFISPSGPYQFKVIKGYEDYDFISRPRGIPTAKWKVASSQTTGASMRHVKSRRKFVGTDWGMAFKIGFAMKPAPDVIFFMADGTGGNTPAPILKLAAQNGRAKINTVAMQTTAGAKQFGEIARKSGGAFTIIDARGQTIDGFAYLKNPKNYRGRL